MSSDGKYYPYDFVADDAFQIKGYMLKPYPRSNRDIEKRDFDYRLSRARCIIENSFGILAARFRIFRRPINAQIETKVLLKYYKSSWSLAQLSHEVTMYVWRIHVLPSQFC